MRTHPRPIPDLEQAGHDQSVVSPLHTMRDEEWRQWERTQKIMDELDELKREREREREREEK